MRQVIFISILIFASQIVLGQKVLSKIDSISSNEEVEKFIHSLIKKKKEFTLIADSANTQPFYKTDFDNNGLTDLLAIGSLPTGYTMSKGRDSIIYSFDTFIVMNFGKDSVKMMSLGKGLMPDFELPKITNDTILTLGQKKLIFKFGNFIEFNPRPKIYKIKKIEYQTSPCYGTCPVFSIQIKEDKLGIFKAENHNSKTGVSIIDYLDDKASLKETRGTFKAVISDDAYSNIVDLLNYIDFPSLDENYSVNWTDDQSCFLKITYDSGKKKKISDYGLIGTYGLDRLYELIFELRFNQKWK